MTAAICVADAIVVVGKRTTTARVALAERGAAPARRRWPARCAGAGPAGASTPCERCTHAHRVLDGDELRPGGLHVALAAAEAGQDQRLPPVTRWARLSLVDTLHGQRAAARARARSRAVSGVADRKLPPSANEHPRTSPRCHRLDRVDGVEAVLRAAARSRTPSPGASRKRGRRPVVDAHRAIALHVAVPAHRAQARARPPDVAAQQQQVDDLLDVGDRVRVLGEAHRPAGDDPLACRRAAAASRAHRRRGRRRSPRRASSHGVGRQRVGATPRSPRCARR